MSTLEEVIEKARNDPETKEHGAESAMKSAFEPDYTEKE